MRRVLRQNAICTLLALGASFAMGWLTLVGFAWSDYEAEVLPAYNALLRGHVISFLRLAPAYGGSLLERAPFALAPELWGGGAFAVYRMVALPCLLAAAALGVFLVHRMRAAGHSTLARAVALGVCVANPITLRGLEFGHPEDLLGGCLCVAAVLVAERQRPLTAGLLLGLAIANKEWALLAIGPVLLVLPANLRLRCALSAGVSAGAILAPFTLAAHGVFGGDAQLTPVSSSPIFQPWQVWWFLGRHVPRVYGAFGAVKLNYRVAPAWVNTVSHPLIILFGFAVAGALWLRVRAKPLPLRDALLALALVLLARCLLDTWDFIYYSMPCVLALLAWETHGAPKRPPVIALCLTIALWLNFYWIPEHGYSPDFESALLMAWALPFAAWLGMRLFSSTRPALAGGSAPHKGSRGGRPQEMTVSSLDRLVSTS